MYANYFHRRQFALNVKHCFLEATHKRLKNRPLKFYQLELTDDDDDDDDDNDDDVFYSLFNNILSYRDKGK